MNDFEDWEKTTPKIKSFPKKSNILNWEPNELKKQIQKIHINFMSNLENNEIRIIWAL